MDLALPEKFIEKMKAQLPSSEWDAFFSTYEKPPYKGVRVNPFKCTRARFMQCAPFALRPVPWEENGFFITEEKVGGHPYHFAGVYYSQEPSAMSAVPLLDVQPYEKVLDLCSAPGGKATQIASKMDGKGILVCNEPIPSRAKILQQNVERMGVTNAVVLSALPEKLTPFFAGYFDKILVDAPCSGEGMFRKNAKEAIGEWSEEIVALCAERQKRIFDEAYKMLAVGGKMVYSTCTFSVEEDEGLVQYALQNYPSLRLLQSQKRLPHREEGEGHFVALFQKTEGENRSLPPFLYKTDEKKVQPYRDFERKTFTTPFAEKVYEKDGVLYALPKDVFAFSALPVLRVGVRLGELRNGRFEPSHSLAMAVRGDDLRSVFRLQLGDKRVEKFLRGESVEWCETDGDEPKNGWCVVTVDGFAIGWGKAVDGVIKNHIPKGLRFASVV